jgi:hypothetical protein
VRDTVGPPWIATCFLARGHETKADKENSQMLQTLLQNNDAGGRLTSNNHLARVWKAHVRGSRYSRYVRGDEPLVRGSI